VFEGLLRAKIEGAIASGVYDRGVETIGAESLVVAERRTIYTHPGSGAQTQVFTIRRRDRNEPLSLEDALESARERNARLLINTQSGRAAVQVSAPSLMLDDGAVERRVRLLRPMERIAISIEALDQTHWEATSPETFTQAWNAELADVPTFTESDLHIVTGLLLPIWKRLPSEHCRVYRLQTDDGERIIGRVVPLAWVAQATDAGPSQIAPDTAWNAVIADDTILELQDALSLRRVRVMHGQRVELFGFTDGMVDRLKALGLMSEIISWRLRLFVPIGAQGPDVLARLMERHPLVRLESREAA
jgi:hypothetical protein